MDDPFSANLCVLALSSFDALLFLTRFSPDAVFSLEELLVLTRFSPELVFSFELVVLDTFLGFSAASPGIFAVLGFSLSTDIFVAVFPGENWSSRCNGSMPLSIASALSQTL